MHLRSVSAFCYLYRCVADHQREGQFPFLDEGVVTFLQSLPVHHKVRSSIVSLPYLFLPKHPVIECTCRNVHQYVISQVL